MTLTLSLSLSLSLSPEGLIFAETEMFRTFVVRRLVTKVSGENYVDIFKA
jgi:hypothetical protein